MFSSGQFNLQRKQKNKFDKKKLKLENFQKIIAGYKNVE